MAEPNRDPEIVGIGVILQTLAPFDDAERKRMLDYAKAWCEDPKNAAPEREP